MRLVPASQEIVSFIKSDFRDINVPPLAPASEQLFSEFFTQLEVAEAKFSKLRITSVPMYGIKGKLFEHIPAPIRETINPDDRMDHFVFKFKYRTVNIYISHVPNLAKYMKNIYLWFHFVDMYASTKCSLTVNAYINLTPFTKRIPNDGSPIDQINANTAFTTFCSSNTDIHVYRFEEWFKVLIHESFHSLGLEFSPFANSDTNRKILEMFAVKSDVNLGESYAEIWAEIINCVIVSYLSVRDKENHTRMLKKLNELLNIETKFSLFQCAKVLRHNHIKYSDFFSGSSATLCNYSENANVLSYYVIKSILMYHKDEFIEWCVSNNKNPLDFKKTPTGINRYCSLISDLYRNPDFIRDIQTAATIRGFDDTLRMTAIEN
jgi:hypothetical protein